MILVKIGEHRINADQIASVSDARNGSQFSNSVYVVLTNGVITLVGTDADAFLAWFDSRAGDAYKDLPK